MKKNIISLSLILILSLVIGIGSFADEIDFGAKGAEGDESITLEEMLKYAVQDEYLARMEYEKIMDEFGEQRPFSNIIKAEEYHIELLNPLLEKYDIVVEDSSEDYVVVPESIEEALEVGIQAEIDNIAMYEKFLATDLPSDVELVFEELMSASENHLSAFERTSERSSSGRGRLNRSK